MSPAHARPGYAWAHPQAPRSPLRSCPGAAGKPRSARIGLQLAERIQRAVGAKITDSEDRSQVRCTVRVQRLAWCDRGRLLPGLRATILARLWLVSVTAAVVAGVGALLAVLSVLKRRGLALHPEGVRWVSALALWSLISAVASVGYQMLFFPGLVWVALLGVGLPRYLVTRSSLARALVDGVRWSVGNRVALTVAASAFVVPSLLSRSGLMISVNGMSAATLVSPWCRLPCSL